MSKLKKIIISICCGILLFMAGFCTRGRLRLARVSGAGEGLEQRIDDARNSADSIDNKLDPAGNLGKSAAANGQAINDGIGTIQQSSEELGIFFNEVVRAIEADQKATADFERLHNSTSTAELDALDIAIQHSEQYEQLIQSLQQAVDNFTKNNKESK